MDKRLIAPICVAIILTALLITYIVIWAMLPVPPVVKIIIFLVLVSLIGVTVFVLIERIKEIRSGEIDDLSQY